MCDEDKTSNSVQACSDLAHVVLVLESRVTVVIVHIGLDGVLVVIHFCVAILFVIFCIRRYSLYKLFGGVPVRAKSPDADLTPCTEGKCVASRD